MGSDPRSSPSRQAVHYLVPQFSIKWSVTQMLIETQVVPAEHGLRLRRLEQTKRCSSWWSTRIAWLEAAMIAKEQGQHRQEVAAEASKNLGDWN
jgi:hypothetical protein